MGKLLGMLVKLLTTLLLLVLIVAASLFFLVNPERFRPALMAGFEQQTGLQLDLAGELSLTLQPRVSLLLQDVRIRHPQAPRELASAPGVVLDVDPWRLVQGELALLAMRIDDLHVNWHTDSDGISNWQGLFPAAGGPLQEADVSSAALLATLPAISLRNASVDIQNLAAPYQYSLRNLDLAARDANAVNRAFPLEASFDLLDSLTGNPVPVRVSSTTRVDLDQGDMELGDLRVAVTPMLLQGEMQLRDLGGNSSTSGRLMADAFDARALLTTLGLVPEPDPAVALGTPMAALHEQTSLQVTFNSDARQLRISDLRFQLGDMQASGEATVRYGEGILPRIVSYTLQTGPLDLTPFRSSPTMAQSPDDPVPSPPSSATASAGSTLWTRLEGWMRNSAVQGSIGIAAVRLGDLSTGYINVFTNLEDDVLDIETQAFAWLEGTAQSTLRIDSRAARSELSSRIRLDRVNVADLPLPLVQPDALGGLLSLEANLQTRGDSTSQWLDNLIGSAAFRVTDNSLDIGLVKQVFIAIAALSPRGEAIQQWPDVIRVADFNGYVVFDDGVQNQQLQVRLDNFDIQGSGGIDPVARRFAYDLQFTVMGEPLPQTIPIDAIYHDVHWPVQCAAAFDAEISQLCRPDFPRVRVIFSELGNTVAVPLPLSRVTPEQLPEAARALLPNLFPVADPALP
jgi:AsmA protein